MKWNEAFIYTLREDPAEAELVSHKLMIRAGMIRKVTSGIYYYLPAGLRVMKKIEGIIRQEMDKAGASELLMPSVIPASLWRESGRWDHYGPELLRFTDRKENEYCLGPTHEEPVVDIARSSIRSYRDLPACLYQIQSKFRDEVRPRFGLMRGREFLMKDGYSFHMDEESLDEMYWRMHDVYTTIFSRCGLEFRPVVADSGAIGGDVTHEFHVLADSGEDAIAYCSACGYTANIEKAESGEAYRPAVPPEDAPMPEDVETPGQKTIEDLSDFLSVPVEKTVKMLVYKVFPSEGETYYTSVCIRGDMDVNEVKLKNYLGAERVEIPEESELRKEAGLTIGYLGAYRFTNSAIKGIYADNSVKTMEDCVCGGNREDLHVRHIYPERDFSIDGYWDFSFVSGGDACPECDSGKLAIRRGIEVGQIFKLGEKYSSSMSMSVLDKNGKEVIPVMGCYGIGIGRAAAAAIEQNHDKDGIIWPMEIAPWQVIIDCLDPAEEDIYSYSLKLHDFLEGEGYDVLLDSRDERPGVKFKDADLLGIPLRIVVGSRGMKNRKIEVKPRREKDRVEVDMEEPEGRLLDILRSLT